MSNSDLIQRIEYILDPAATAQERLHRRAHLTGYDLRCCHEALISQMEAKRLTVTPDDTRIKRLETALSKLRHAYTYLRRGAVINQPRLASGLIGPAIVKIERAVADLTTK